jgi:hypothetical protein
MIDTESLTDARILASEWHDGQSSALYAFSSSGHVDASTETELERVERDLRTRPHVWPEMDVPSELDRVADALTAVRAVLAEMPEDTSEDRSTDHGYDVCPDCGNGGVKMDASGYVPCTRFLTCWADVDTDSGDVNPAHDH